MGEGALDDVTVVELCQNIAGPYAGWILGTLGARVLKVERPGSGDVTRGWAPPYWGDDSVMFAVVNTGKESLALDLNDTDDRDTLLELLDHADVVLAAWRPGTLERLGFGYEALAARNPRLVYCSISGFGNVGPLADAPGFDPLIQAFSGLMSLTGEEDGAPVRAGTSIIDMGTGLWSALGVLTALRRRDATGEGCEVTSSLLETGIAWLPYQIAGYFSTGQEPVRHGSGLGMLVPYQAFEAADRPIVIAAGNDSLWRRLCAAIDRTDLAEDPDLATNPQRVGQRDRVVTAISETIGQRPAGHWEAALSEAGVPCSVVQTVGEAARHPQTVATEMLAHVAHPDRDPLVLPALPFALGGERPGPVAPPPPLGHRPRTDGTRARGEEGSVR